MQLTDEELWALCLEGKKNAFEQIYTRFYSLLYNYGTKFVADKELVKDTIQDLFIKLIQNHKTLSTTLYVKSYLLRAFRNKLFDTLDKQKMTEDIAEYQDQFVTEDLFQLLFPDNQEQDNQVKRLSDSFSLLSSRQQEILYLYYIGELTHDEIADILGINYQSSKNLLFRSVSKLRTFYFSEEK